MSRWHANIVNNHHHYPVDLKLHLGHQKVTVMVMNDCLTSLLFNVNWPFCSGYSYFKIWPWKSKVKVKTLRPEVAYEPVQKSR